jgi:hypothetical protein
VTVAVLVDVILRDGLAPGGATLKLDVVDVDTGIDDVHVDTLTAGRVVLVESESSETEFRRWEIRARPWEEVRHYKSRDESGIEEHTHGAKR